MHSQAINENPLRSALRSVGFTRIDDWIEPPLLKSLREESFTQRENALRATENGALSYSGFLADLGTVALDFLTGPSMHTFLQTAFGQEFELTRGSSCYTYYEAGDFLGAHKDGSDDCEVTVLVYLEAESPDARSSETGLKLQVYEDCEGIPGTVRHTIETRCGSIIAGRGAKIWHGRPPLQDGERVYLLTACYSAIR